LRFLKMMGITWGNNLLFAMLRGSATIRRNQE
jgi:hypothetical protein